MLRKDLPTRRELSVRGWAAWLPEEDYQTLLSVPYGRVMPCMKQTRKDVRNALQERDYKALQRGLIKEVRTGAALFEPPPYNLNEGLTNGR